MKLPAIAAALLMPLAVLAQDKPAAAPETPAAAPGKPAAKPAAKGAAAKDNQPPVAKVNGVVVPQSCLRIHDAAAAQIAARLTIAQTRADDAR